MANKTLTMAGVGTMAFGVIAIIVAFSIIPAIGSQMDTAVTIPATGAGSQWNSSVNTAIPTAVDFWESVGGILKLAGFLAVVIGFVVGLKGLRG